MGRVRGSARARASVVFAAATLAWAGSCKVLSTDILLREYNGGLTDSLPDPELSLSEIADERVILTVRSSLTRGYFTQGPANDDTVADWLENPRVQGLAWKHVLDRTVSARHCSEETRSPPSATPGSDEPEASPSMQTQVGGFEKTLEPCAQQFRVDLFKIIVPGMVTPKRDKLCVQPGPSVPTLDAAKLSDAMRLAAALDLASVDLARVILDEEVVTTDLAQPGFLRSMKEAAAYLRARRWQPSLRAPTFGIAIKGGASTGVFSAGAVWRILTMMEEYQAWKGDRAPKESDIAAKETRFTVASGTSAGAVIAAAVDLFHQKTCVIDPAADDFRRAHDLKKDELGAGRQCQDYARRILATLFTCTDQSELYCVDSQLIWNLADDQKGLMDFDKLRALLWRHVGGNALVNPTELVLTTVDFRWGNLYAQSDQDPSTVTPTPWGAEPSSASILDVHRSIEGSFVLPFIARPVDKLRIHGAAREGIYLDGGIKSELPLLSLMQRGVERAVVVGSGPPQITPTKPQDNALEIAIRYMDVSLSAVTEGEWKAAIPMTRYVEEFEYAACDEATFEGFSRTEKKAFCTGNLAAACNAKAGYRQHDAGNGHPGETGRRFDVLGIFRKEEVDPTFGYTFDPVQMRRLFMAGAEASRQRCTQLAAFLGMGDAGEAQLSSWCNITPIEEHGLCSPPNDSTTMPECE